MTRFRQLSSSKKRVILSLSKDLYLICRLLTDRTLLKIDIKVYPNPSTGIINISKKQFSQEISYRLIDQVGKVIISGKIENGKQSLN